MFFNLYIFLLVFYLIQGRNYESIYTIKDKLFDKIHKVNIKFEIQGTNNYLYKFESQSIFHNFKYGNFDDIQKNIVLSNEKVEILFNLLIYEANDKIFNDFDKSIVYTEFIKVGIKFDTLRFFQYKSDFSFEIFYKINNIDNDIIIYFERIDKLETFNYLLYEDKHEIYKNKTLFDYMKIKASENFIKSIRDLLTIYPECDLLYYMKEYIEKFVGKVFKINYYINAYLYYKIIIDSFHYSEIIKMGDTIILKESEAKISLIGYNEYGESDDDMEDKIEKHVIAFENLSIDSKKILGFGRQTKGEYFVFDIFKLILRENKDRL